jgi:hypothetical protein
MFLFVVAVPNTITITVTAAILIATINRVVLLFKQFWLRGLWTSQSTYPRTCCAASTFSFTGGHDTGGHDTALRSRESARAGSGATPNTKPVADVAIRIRKQSIFDRHVPTSIILSAHGHSHNPLRLPIRGPLP